MKKTKFNTTKMNKWLLTSVVLFLILTITLFCGCVDTGEDNPPVEKNEYTLTFVTNGGTTIDPITAPSGASIPTVKNPTKKDAEDTYEFIGWYLTADFSGESVTIPSTMPAEDITYYAYFKKVEVQPETITIEYNVNLSDVHYTAIENGTTTDLSTFKTADGNAFGVEGYLFLCWTTTANGPISLSGIKENGQYFANDTIVSNDKNITLYARWAKAYTDVYEKSEDIIYVCDEIIGKGLGAATLVRADKDNKLGFVVSGKDTQSGHAEFTFYFDENEGGEVTGRLYSDTFTYAFPDGLKGEYLEYDYIYGENTNYILALDGFGDSIMMKLVGNETSVYMYGTYEYDEEYNDYCFIGLDPETKEPLLNEEGEIEGLYFILTTGKVENTQFDGTFVIQGYESGSYLLYENGELYEYRLDLNGYGGAKLHAYNPINERTELLATGTYCGTENYESIFGEYQFTLTSGEYESFKFLLSYITSSDGYTLIYIEYNQYWDKTFTDESGIGDTLYTDGYGGVSYTAGGNTIEGVATFGENLVTFIPYVNDENGNQVAGKKLFFNVDHKALTFKVNSDGFVVDGTTIINYEGEADIVVIPTDVTKIGDNAFNYTYTDVSLVSVQIPASVVSIGKHAFQNHYTLQRVIFLSETPIDIDWSANGDPFRWGAGNFVIVVPEGSQDAYRTAWANCKYQIKGSVEVTILPEFEVVDGILVKYNKQPDTSEELEITIPDEVTEIASYVFRGLTYIKSVNLNNVTKIGDYAFYGNSGLVSVTLSNVEFVGEGAFADCVNLDCTIELPKVVTLGANAFASCEKLKLIRLGENLTEIGDQAFFECQIYYGEDPLFVELLGENPPELGGGIGKGNISFKIKVKDISVAIKCYDTPSWNKYIKFLYIESGSEKGTYLSGTDTLVLDGRAELMGSLVMMYEINQGYIVFYLYDDETATYNTIMTEFKNNSIILNIYDTEYVFTKVNESGVKTYTSADGKYTLEVNPIDLIPDSYEELPATAEGTLNGTSVEIIVSGYQNSVIKNYVVDGKKYNFTFHLDGDSIVYTMKLADGYVKDIEAEDGSIINIHYTATSIYVYGTLKIDVGDGKMMPSWGDWSILATDCGNNTYTFVKLWLNTKYQITITLSEDLKCFTYEYEIV